MAPETRARWGPGQEVGPTAPGCARDGGAIPARNRIFRFIDESTCVLVVCISGTLESAALSGLTRRMPPAALTHAIERLDRLAGEGAAASDRQPKVPAHKPIARGPSEG